MSIALTELSLSMKALGNERIDLKEELFSEEYKLSKVKKELSRQKLKAEIEVYHYDTEKRWKNDTQRDLAVKKFLQQDLLYQGFEEDFDRIFLKIKDIEIDLRKNLVEVQFQNRNYEIMTGDK